MWKSTTICNALFMLYIFASCKCHTEKNYGEFILKIVNLEICKGPKRLECTNITSNLVNDTTVLVDVHLDEDVVMTRGKIEATMNDKPLIRLQMKKPCDHLFIKPLFEQMYHIGQNCIFKKGDYNLKIDIEDVAQKYYGGMFIFGNLTFKAMFFNDKCNFSCSKITVTFSPKNKA